MNNYLDQFILLFECNRVVQGASQSIIIDIQRKSYIIIPNNLAEVLLNLNGKTYSDVISVYKNLGENLKHNLDILLKNEILFCTKNPELFPKMNLTWNSYSKITNCILDYSSFFDTRLKDLIHQLEEVRCEHLQIRFFEKISSTRINEILSLFENSRIVSVELICPKNEQIENYISLIKRYPIIFSMILSDCKESQGMIYSSKMRMGHIYGTAEKINSIKHCGKIASTLFTIDIKSYTESLNQNSCLNRKISIDADGDIKNCPSMSKSYGNVRETTLEEAIEKQDFKKYWDINKDKIHVCRDCEFRYICTDCRAYVEDPEDILSKPLKFGYNPYTGEWSKWSTNPLKQKAIDFYGMREMVEEMNRSSEE